jgi:sigma-E factor negative regulatory protein RseA
LDERISALMDSELGVHAHPGAVQQLLAGPEALRVWHRYHVVGDVLRSAELATAASDHAFLEKLSYKLAQEPGRPQWDAPRAVDSSAVDHSARNFVPGIPSDPVRVAANASVWQWKLLAGAACSALVAVVGLGLWNQTTTPSEQQLAMKAAPQSAQELAAVAGDAGVMLRDPQLDALIAAHQQLGGHSALQAPSGFLRNATYQGNSR